MSRHIKKCCLCKTRVDGGCVNFIYDLNKNYYEYYNDNYHHFDNIIYTCNSCEKLHDLTNIGNVRMPNHIPKEQWENYFIKTLLKRKN